VWGVGGFCERERFTSGVDPVERSGGSLHWSQWLSPLFKVSLETAVEDWDQPGTLNRSRGGVRVLTRGGRLEVQAGAELWTGANVFSRSDISAALTSSTSRRGLVYLARAGAATGTARLPPLLWFAGDTGQTREMRLRAHPLVDDGRLQVEQMGRRLLGASMEAQRWWSLGLVRVAAAAFIDSARATARLDTGTRGDVDAGVGVRLALPGAGTIRADIANGLLHDGTRWSFVYEP
jgi:hypothetical protein